MGQRKQRDTAHVRVLLCKPEVDDFDAVIADRTNVARRELVQSLPFEGTVFLQETREKKPDWADFLGNAVESGLADLVNASNAVVLLIRRHLSGQPRIFAIPFSYGRSLLRQELLEREFGLSVALAGIDSSTLRSVDASTISEEPSLTRKQVAAGSRPAAFELDVYSDALRAVTGRAAEPDLGLLTGTEGVRSSKRVSLEELGNHCDRLFSIYESGRDSQAWWVSKLRPVRDPALKMELEDSLEQLLNGPQPTAHAQLAPPDLVPWERVSAFKLQGTGNPRELRDLDELELATYLGEAGQPVVLSQMRGHHVSLHEDDPENWIDRWTVYRCLMAEVRSEDHLYVLYDGQWWQFAADLVSEVDTYLRDVETTNPGLPPIVKGEHEADYNGRVAEGREDTVLLDKQDAPVQPGQGRVEPCDLLIGDDTFVHVKWWRSSRELSHLFEQGVVASSVFLREASWRADLRWRIDEAGRAGDRVAPEGRPRAADYRVVFAVLGPPSGEWPVSLPFLSRLSLMRAVRSVGEVGYHTSVVRVPVQQEP